MIRAPLKLKTHDWLVPVRMETQAELVGQPPKFNLRRNLMCFKDGKVYDWDTDKFQDGEAWMLISSALPYCLEDWPVDLKRDYDLLIGDIMSYYKTGKTLLQQYYDEDNKPMYTEAYVENKPHALSESARAAQEPSQDAPTSVLAS